jgi:hypothetical protein
MTVEPGPTRHRPIKRLEDVDNLIERCLVFTNANLLQHAGHGPTRGRITEFEVVHVDVTRAGARTAPSWQTLLAFGGRYLRPI